MGAITARAEAQLLRLSLVYALLDGAHAIDVPHLLAALAVWRYAEASAAHIFGGVLGSDTADRLLVELRAVYPDGLDREAQSALFHRNRAEAELEAARRQLEARGLAQRRSVPSDTGKGRPREVLCAVPPATKEPKETKKEAKAEEKPAAMVTARIATIMITTWVDRRWRRSRRMRAFMVPCRRHGVSEV